MHEIKRVNEMDIENYIKNSRDLIIMVTSSYCQEDRQGTYTCLLLYQGHRKVVTGVFQDVPSANLITVLGVLEAVKQIKLTGVNVCVISYIALGFKGAKVGNGLYANEVNEIVRLIAEQGNTLSSIAVIDGKDIIKKIILEEQ